MTPDPATLPTRERRDELRESLSGLNEYRWQHAAYISASEVRALLDAADRAEAAEALLREADEVLGLADIFVPNEDDEDSTPNTADLKERIHRARRAVFDHHVLAGTPAPPQQPPRPILYCKTCHQPMPDGIIGDYCSWLCFNDRPKEIAPPQPSAPRTSSERAANALADEVAALVERRVIDSRSPAADALLDYRAPPNTETSRRRAALDTALAKLGEKVRAYADERTSTALVAVLDAAREVVAAMVEDEK